MKNRRKPETTVFFKGRLLDIFGFRASIFICAVILLVFVLFIRDLTSFTSIVLYLFALVAIVVPVSVSNFFGVSCRYLVVKNQCVPIFKMRFILSDIREVQFDDNEGWTDVSLIVILKKTKENEQGRSFPGFTLREKEWSALKNELEDKGVKVTSYVLGL